MGGEGPEEAKRILFRIKARSHLRFPRVIVIGGKPTGNLDTMNPGKGGRMSILAVLLAERLAKEKLDNGRILAADTDGVDGDCDVAGGIVDSQTIQKQSWRG